MNNLISSNSIIRKYGLRRVPYYWGFKDTSHIYYMVAPPWVHLLVNDVVNFAKISKVQSKDQDEEGSDAGTFSSD